MRRSLQEEAGEAQGELGGAVKSEKEEFSGSGGRMCGTVTVGSSGSVSMVGRGGFLNILADYLGIPRCGDLDLWGSLVIERRKKTEGEAAAGRRW